MNKLLLTLIAVTFAVPAVAETNTVVHGTTDTKIPDEVFSITQGPCSGEEDCSENVKLKNGIVVGVIVKRTVDKKGNIKKWIKDAKKGLVWHPKATTGGPKGNGKMTQNEAKKYCESKELRLPTPLEFMIAFNPERPKEFTKGFEKFFKNFVRPNISYQKFQQALINNAATHVLDVDVHSMRGEESLWSSWSLTDRAGWGFFDSIGDLASFMPHSVRCVS